MSLRIDTTNLNTPPQDVDVNTKPVLNIVVTKAPRRQTSLDGALSRISEQLIGIVKPLAMEKGFPITKVSCSRT